MIIKEDEKNFYTIKINQFELNSLFENLRSIIEDKSWHDFGITISMFDELQPHVKPPIRKD